MKRLMMAVLFLCVAGCSFAPTYVQPYQQLPDTWAEVSPADQKKTLERQWWRRFGDETLDALVEKALAHNRDIAQGLARVDSARAALGLARAGQFPQISGQGQGARSQSSREALASYGLEQELGLLESRVSRLEGLPASPQPVSGRVGTLWSGTVQAVWELDIWGRWRNAASAAREKLFSAEDTQRALELSVAGQVCSAYFDLLNYRTQQKLTEKTLAARQASAEIYERQYSAGAISELDILNVRTQVDSLRDSLAQAKSRVEQAEAALLLLTGASPQEIYAGRAGEGLPLERMAVLPQLPAGLPSELLARRPDIRAAEALLRAAHFQVGVARAAFFPSISLTGSLGVESMELGRLFSGAAGTWSFSGGLSLPILTFGKELGGVRQAEAVMREATAAYEQAVQQAFGDVRDALAVQRGMAESVQSLAEASTRMEKAAELARLRYREGWSPYLDVLEAERTLYGTQMSLAQRQAAQLSAIAQVCVALGGGW